MNVAENVKKYRKAAGLSQKELAKACAVNQSFIAHIETGRKLPSLLCARDIARACGCELRDLIS